MELNNSGEAGSKEPLGASRTNRGLLKEQESQVVRKHF